MRGIFMCRILLRAKQPVSRGAPFRPVMCGSARPTGSTGHNHARANPDQIARVHYLKLARAGAVAIAVSASGVAQQASAPQPHDKTDQQLLVEFSQKSPSELLSKYFERPPYPLFVIRRLIDLGDPVVLPNLRLAFEQESSILTRQFLAAALVCLGDTDARYFQYVARAGLDAATSDLPYRDRPAADPTQSDVLQRHDEILAWALAHHQSALDTIRRATIEFPAAVEALGETADHRSLTILLRGLNSPNFLVIRAAAFGLARLHDAVAVQPIITACRTLTPKERPLVAKSLLYFDGRPAQKAAESMIGDPERLHRWRGDVNRNGWRAAMRDRALQ